MDPDLVTKTVVGALVGVAYPDSLKPAAQEVGSVMGKVVQAALSPVRGFVWGFEKLRERIFASVEEKLKAKGVPPERMAIPEPTVVVPALLAMSYSMHQQTLRNMYTNLLSAAMDSQTASEVHPSFVEVVKQLTPDEVRILEVLRREDAAFYDVYAEPPGFAEQDGEQVGVTDLFRRAGCQDLAHADVAVSNLERQQLAIFEPLSRREARTWGDVNTVRVPDFVQPNLERLREQGTVARVFLRTLRLTAFGRSLQVLLRRRHHTQRGDRLRSRRKSMTASKDWKTVWMPGFRFQQAARRSDAAAVAVSHRVRRCGGQVPEDFQGEAQDDARRRSLRVPLRHTLRARRPEGPEA